MFFKEPGSRGQKQIAEWRNSQLNQSLAVQYTLFVLFRTLYKQSMRVTYKPKVLESRPSRSIYSVPRNISFYPWWALSAVYFCPGEPGAMPRVQRKTMLCLIQEEK